MRLIVVILSKPNDSPFAEVTRTGKWFELTFLDVSSSTFAVVALTSITRPTNPFAP